MFTHPLHDHILTRGFHYKASLYVGGQHAAADYVRRTGPTAGTPILAVANGTVAENSWDQYSGNFIALRHAGMWKSVYRHLPERSRLAVGRSVTQLQLIGNIGNTGVSMGAHLHFDLWNREKRDPTAFFKNGWWAHDPELYLDKEDDDMTPEEVERIVERRMRHDDAQFRDEVGHLIRASHIERDKWIAALAASLNRHTALPPAGGSGGAHTH